MTNRAVFDGPLGRLVLTEEGGAITALEWSRAEVADNGSHLLDEACGQLDVYFAGTRRDFDLPIAFRAGRRGPVLLSTSAALFC